METQDTSLVKPESLMAIRRFVENKIVSDCEEYLEYDKILHDEFSEPVECDDETLYVDVEWEGYNGRRWTKGNYFTPDEANGEIVLSYKVKIYDEDEIQCGEFNDKIFI